MRLNNMKWFSYWAFFLIIAFLTIISSSLSWGAEKPYPNRPINLIVGFSPGGSGDLASKFVLEKMSEILGQPFISVYKPGAGGSLANSFVAKAKPDGYTVLLAGTTLIISTILKKVDYKYDDFTHLGILAFNPNRFCVKADARWKTLKDFVGEARKFPGKLTVGSMGKATASHFVLEKFQKEAMINLNHVPFKSPVEAVAGVLGGHVDAALTISAAGLTDSPLIRVLAVAGEKRLVDQPDIPTFTECGYPVEYVGYYFFTLPKGTPKEIVDKLADAQGKVYDRHSTEIKETLRKLDLIPQLSGPEETVKKLRKTYEDVLKMAPELGITEK